MQLIKDLVIFFFVVYSFYCVVIKVILEWEQKMEDGYVNDFCVLGDSKWYRLFLFI